jgi:hypothetical protein
MKHRLAQAVAFTTLVAFAPAVHAQEKSLLDRVNYASPLGDGEASVAKKITGLSLLGVTLVGLGVGVGFLAKASSAEDDRRAFLSTNGTDCKSREQCASLQTIKDDYDAAVTGYVVSMGVASAAGVLALGVGFLWPDKTNVGGGYDIYARRA